MKKSTLFQRFPLHPFLFALYSPLALLAVNVREIPLRVSLRPLFVALLGAAVLLLLAYAVTRNELRAGLIASLVIVLFFSYGHLVVFLAEHPLLGFNLGRNRFLAPFYLLILIGGVWGSLRIRPQTTQLTLVLNAVAVFLVLMPVLQIGTYSARSAASTARISSQPLTTPAPIAAGNTTQPDVYYIILDTYTRGDVMQSVFKWDNSDFLNKLRDLGFYVAECSNANYPSTNISLMSSLNLDYLQEIEKNLPGGDNLDTAQVSLLQHSLARQTLAKRGYKSVAFATGYDWIEWHDADFYFQPLADSQVFPNKLHAFESMLLDTTAVTMLKDSGLISLRKTVVDADNSLTDNDRASFLAAHDRQALLLKQMEAIDTLPSPKFVYAHVMLTHGPFLFSDDGKLLNSPDDPNAQPGDYAVQVKYTNEHMLKIIHNILTQSSTPPIIVIQGDHGVAAHRQPILNAYYLPGVGKDQLYPSISPVNTFRVIFNTYFGESYALLPDLSYTASHDHLESFNPKPVELPACPAR